MRFNKVTLFLLVGILAGASGCRKEHQYAEASTHKTDASYGESRSSIKASASPVSPEERDVQNNLKKIADWRSYLEASKGNTHIASRISRGMRAGLAEASTLFPIPFGGWNVLTVSSRLPFHTPSMRQTPGLGVIKCLHSTKFQEWWQGVHTDVMTKTISGKLTFAT